MTTINSRIASTCAGILFVAACLSVSQAGAETSESRIVMHLTKAERVEVADVPGHVLVVGEQMGLRFMADGEAGIYSGWFTADYTNGSGKHEGYSATTFDDGSRIVTRMEGTTKASEDGRISEFKGAFSYVSGSGRFEGIRGKGTYVGRRVAPLSAGADGYIDLSSSYTMPPGTR